MTDLNSELQAANDAAMAKVRKNPPVLEIRVARVCHEVNRVLQGIAGEEPSPAWEQAPEWQRESAIAGVRAAIDGTATTPEQQHESWCQHKIADGWVHGAVKDAEAKTHHCLVPYDELPPIQRAKDEAFRAIVSALLNV